MYVTTIALIYMYTQGDDSTDPYQLFLGKDYANSYIKEAPDPDKPFEGQHNQ